MALAAAHEGADIVIHHAHSPVEAAQTASEISEIGGTAWVLSADLSDPCQATQLMEKAFNLAPVTALINNASIFKPTELANTSLEDWNQHLQINLTSPFLLSQSFAVHFDQSITGRIINILDWRALRPGKDHFAYTISKSALAAMTRSTAVSLAPHIVVNGIALGAILPPPGEEFSDNFIRNVPMRRWSSLDELGNLVTYLLTAPAYLTGEIIHLDGGRHLV